MMMMRLALENLTRRRGEVVSFLQNLPEKGAEQLRACARGADMKSISRGIEEAEEGGGLGQLAIAGGSSLLKVP